MYVCMYICVCVCVCVCIGRNKIGKKRRRKGESWTGGGGGKSERGGRGKGTFGVACISLPESSVASAASFALGALRVVEG